MSKDTSFIKVGKEFCKSQKSCSRKCPLFSLPCVNNDGNFTISRVHSIEDVYAMLYYIANFDGDNDFMK